MSDDAKRMLEALASGRCTVAHLVNAGWTPEAAQAALSELAAASLARRVSGTLGETWEVTDEGMALAVAYRRAAQ